MFLEAVGRVDTLHAALGVHQRYAGAGGRRFRTFDGEVQLPARFRDRVIHISGLDTRIRHRHRLDVTFDGQAQQVLGPQPTSEAAVRPAAPHGGGAALSGEA